MLMLIALTLLIQSFISIEAQTAYETNVKFQCWSNATNSFNSPLNDDMVANGCPATANGKFE